MPINSTLINSLTTNIIMNNIFTLLRCICVFIFFAGVVNAAPSISISSMYDVLNADDDSIVKRIYNTGTSTAFIRVELFEIDIADEGAVVESEFSTFSGNSLNKESLIVTPGRMIIPAGGFQNARIIWPGSRDKERYFRLRFIPVLPEQSDSFGLNQQEMNSYRKKILQAGVNVLAGYGALLYVHPQTPTFNTSIVSTAKNISITNKGNATIILEDIKQCRSGHIDCGAASRMFITPGKNYQIERTPAKAVNFTLFEGKSKKAMSY